MKKTGIIFLSFIMILGFVGCQKEDVAPVIAGADSETILQGATFDILDGVSATDTEDGDLTSSIVTDGFVDASILGEHAITYTVTDSAENVTKVTRIITVEYVVDSPSSLYNGDFSLNDGGWTFDKPGGEVEFTVVEGVLNANITNIAQEWWNIQVHQMISIEENVTYKISLDAKTDTSKRLGLGIEDTGDGYAMLPGGDVVFDLTTEMATYEYYYTSDRTIDTAKFVLYLGRIGEDESPAKVYLDNISVEVVELDSSEIVFTGVEETTVVLGSDFDLLAGVSAVDGSANDITASIVTNNVVTTDLNKGANFTVQYSATDGTTTKYVDRIIRIVLGKDDPTTLFNSNFELGTMGWTLDFPVGEGTMTVVAGVLEANLTNLGDAWWHIQLSQAGISITEGKSYTVSFKAKADGVKRIALGIEDPANNYADLKGESVEWDLTTEWVTYTYTFSAPSTIDSAKYAIFLGKIGDTDELTKVYIDDFTVTELSDSYPVLGGLTTINVVEGTTIDLLAGVTVSDLEDTNIALSSIVVDDSTLDINVVGEYTVTYTITDSAGNVTIKSRTVNILEDTDGPMSVVANTDMEGTDGWAFDFPGGVGTMTYTAGQLVAELTDLSDALWKIQLQQDSISIVEDSLYLVSVDMMSSVDRVVSLGLEDAGNGFADLKGGESVEWSVTSDMTTFYYIFRAPSTIDNAKLALFLGQITGTDPVSTVTIDNFNMALVDDYNILQNSNFADDTIWNYDFPVGTGTMAAADNKLTATLTTLGDAGWNIQLHQTDISIMGDFSYLVSFKVKTDVVRRIGLGIEDGGNGFADLKGGEVVEWDITTDWTTCYYVFDSSDTIDTAKFALFLGQITGTDLTSIIEVMDFVVIQLN